MLRPSLSMSFATMLALAALVGCAETRTDAEPAPLPGGPCAACHGSEKSSAPPADLLGNRERTFRGVGAHEAHLFATHGLSVPVACQTCHLVPAATLAPGHLDDAGWPAEVIFGGLAVAKGAQPTIVAPVGTGRARDDATLVVGCSATYCHGATLQGGKATRLDWNQPNDILRGCDACHGNPPPAPHPASAPNQCANCHGETVGADGAIADPTKHIDGAVQLGGAAGCSTCHGSDQNAAPPSDVSGETDTSRVTVGAHQVHLNAKLSGSVSCSECHQIPATRDTPGHLDASPAEVVFGVLAKADGAAAAWDRGSGTCATYCHGATLAGGTNSAPMWNKVDDTQAACGTCHGLPPPTPHPSSTLTGCFFCHPQTAAADGSIGDPSKHVDGKVQAKGGGACNSCHGSATNAAPPKDTLGNTDTATLTVGAHQKHLAATRGKPVACAECHAVPAAVSAPDHLDAAPAELAFGALAKAGGATATWDRGAATCATYCHGATLAGGSNTTPKWNKVDGTQAACGACHGLPPPSPHPAATLSTCVFCHPQTAAADGSIADPTKHVDGIVQAQGGGGCDSCHGSAANDAPPRDTLGNTATTAITVGAHQSHLAATLGKSVACSECHAVPAATADPGHLDAAPAEVEFGALSKTGGAAASWARGTATCAAYCHGSNLVGGTLTAPKWTVVNRSQVACGTCHGIPPKTGKHPNNFSDHAGMACTWCHDGLTNSAGTSVLVPGRHVDGKKDVKVRSGTWDGATKSCLPACHGEKEW